MINQTKYIQTISLSSTLDIPIKIVYIEIEDGNVRCQGCGKTIARRDKDTLTFKCGHKDKGHKCGVINKIYLK